MGAEERAVAVFGAAGYTGRFVVAELLRRGVGVVAIARNGKALSDAGFPDEVPCCEAAVHDGPAVARAFDGVHAVINCAGPFADTADAICGAAVGAGIHYLDVTAEQGSASRTLETFDAPARAAGVVVVPSMAFFGGLTDLMATVLTDGWDRADSIEIMVGFDQWRPTQGTRNTIARKGDLAISGGRVSPLATPPRQKHYRFEYPLAEQTVVEVPFTEVPLIPRHIQTDELHSYLTLVAVTEVLNPATPFPKAADALGRSEQQFIVEVVATRSGEQRRGVSRGRDAYAVTAPLVCEAAELLLSGRFASAGAHAPGEIFDARELLSSLGPEYPFEATAN
jgi:hypothetical protein